MNPFLGSVFWLLVTLGVLVTFHEFGHYWVARRCGVKVLRFSVGFGQAIWKRVGRDGTVYQIAAIPLGGYVKMLDAREGEIDPALAGQEFTSRPVWKRIAIVAAGPAFNLIFTIAAFWLMFVIGKPDYEPVISATPHSMAASAGIRDGDRLLSVDGRQVTTFSDSLDGLANALLGREPLPLRVLGADGSQRNVVLPLQQLPPGQDIGQYLGQLGIQLDPPAVVGTLEPGLPASLAGLQLGDRLLGINGQPLTDFESFAKAVTAEAAKSPHLALSVSRGGKPMQFQLDARKEAIDGQPARWLIGVGVSQPIQHYGPLRALQKSLDTTWDRATGVFNMIGKMISGQASTKNLSGVVGIAQVANASASQGFTSFLEFLGLVSLSLAILNLLPIPLLDGGHLLYYLIELIKGSPVSERTMLAGQYIGLALLFTMMGLAFYNDIHRMLLS
jgi:regulator of sigma E protease